MVRESCELGMEVPLSPSTPTQRAVILTLPLLLRMYGKAQNSSPRCHALAAFRLKT